MPKDATTDSHVQLVDPTTPVCVQTPPPLRAALTSAENAFFDLWFGVGQQVL